MFSARRRAGGKQPENVGKSFALVGFSTDNRNRVILVAGGSHQTDSMQVAEECSIN